MGRRVDNLHFGSLLFFSLKSLSFLMMNLISGITGLGHHLFPLVTLPPKTQTKPRLGLKHFTAGWGEGGFKLFT